MPPLVLIVVVAAVVGTILGLGSFFLPAGYLPVALTVTVAVVLLTAGSLAAGVAVLAGKRRRESEAVRLQSRIIDALRADPRLASIPVLPVAHVPVRSDGIARIELEGVVPSDEARSAVLEVVEREVSRAYPRHEIVGDHLHLAEERESGRGPAR
jgi:hypothetical protein